MLVYFRDSLIPSENALLSALSPAFTHGPNVYETVRGYWNQDAGQLYMFRLHDHLRRLRLSINALRFDEVPDVTDLAGLILDCVRANRFREDIHLRIHAFFSDNDRNGSRTTDLLIIPEPRPPRPATPARCRVSSWRRPSDDSLPSRVKAVGNRMFARVAAAEAKAEGYDQILMLNDRGQLAEALSSNIFLVRHGEVCTPPVTAAILEGITRSTLLSIVREDMNQAAYEREIDRSELFDCEEAFLCSTGLEIVPIASIDGRDVGDGGAGPITAELRTRYEVVIRGTNAERPDWRTAVYT